MRFTLLALSATVLSGLFAPAARCSPQVVTVLLQFDHPGSGISSRSMEREVRNVLGHSVDLRFRTGEEEGRSEPGRLVVFRMHGVCSMSGPATEDGNGVSLASTDVSDGVILPFGHVECDRLRASVQRVFGAANPEQHERQLGLAMGRVLAHELYHMLAESKEHTEHGVTKSGLSAFELVGADAAIPPDAIANLENHTARTPTFNASDGR